MIKAITYTILLILSFSKPLWAQPPKMVLLAEPFNYNFKPIAGSEPIMPGQSFGDFEILQTNPEYGTKKEIINYHLLLVAFDTGMLSIPVGFLPAKDSANVFYIKVIAPPENTLQSYAPPIEPVFSRETEWPAYLVPSIITAIVLIIAIIYWLKTRPKKVIAIPAFPLNGLSLLQQIKEAWANNKLNSLQLGEGLVNSLSAQYGISTKKSTRQLLKVIKKYEPDNYNIKLEKLLNKTDAWRFGKQSALPGEGRDAIDSLETLFLSSISNRKPSNENA